MLVADRLPRASAITSASVRSVNEITPVPASYDRSPDTEIAARARPFVKYRFVVPSERSSVSFDASSVLKSAPSK